MSGEQENLSAFQLQERKKRTCFVGNLPLEFNSKQLKKMFQPHGTVEKVWFRSIATVYNEKVPLRARIIKNDFSEQKDNKNAYVLFSSPEEAKKAKEKLNQTEIEEKHIRVDIDYRDPDAPVSRDYDTTIFIGNLPFQSNEEDLRKHFSYLTVGEGNDDGILNVRIIRDPETFIGKGIAYIQFSTKERMRLAIDKRADSLFNGRNIRVKKAVEPKRLEKKKNKTAAMIEKRKEQSQLVKDDEGLLAKGRKFEDAYVSDDSHDEKFKKQQDKEREDKIKDKSKKIKKNKDSADDFAKHMMKISKKSEKVGKELAEEGLDITPRLGFKKKQQMMVNQQKIDKGKSKFEEQQNKKTFKDQPKLKDMLRSKQEGKRKHNLGKINTIKVKKVINK